MRFTFAKFVGYAGFYTGLGKSELTIDFTKCRNNVVVISGANGCGKSTLLNALNILPDGNECFVPSMAASKQLQIVDQDIIYDILITHGLDSRGNRSTTKAYISKNGEELNPNGNVSSYKDIIFNEFSLDNNFITLTHISGDDRGLADKRPAERKKFIASITSSLDVYNDINKTLTKKANVLRSQINTLSDKLRNIGSETDLRNSLISINTRYERINTEIEDLKQKIIECRTVLALNDPDGKLQVRFDEIKSAYENEVTEVSKIFSFITGLEVYDPDIEADIEKIDSLISLHQQLADSQSDLIKENNAKLMILNERLQNSSYDKQKIEMQINKLKQDINPELDSQIQEVRSKMFEIEDIFKKLEITESDDISSGEFKQIANVLNDILRAADTLYEIVDDEDLPKFVEVVSSGVPLSIQIAQLGEQNTSNMEEIMSLTTVHDTELIPARDAYDELNKRPSNCKINNCYFLDSLKSKVSQFKSENDLIKQIKATEQKIQELQSQNNKNSELMNLYRNWISGEAIFDKIETLISSNMALIEKIPMFTRLTNPGFIGVLISAGYKFNDLRDLSIIYQASNSVIEYNSLKKVYTNLVAERKTNDSNINRLKELETELTTLETEDDKTRQERDIIINDIRTSNELVDANMKKISALKEYRSYADKYKSHKDNMLYLKAELDKIQQQFKGSSDILASMTDMNNKISSLEAELAPINDQKKIVESNLVLADSYKRDYDEYSINFDIINKLKKYSSPTSGGIQTIFMNLYMGQTLSTANQLLGMLFQGQYQLAEYVINQDEFRIPFLSNGFMIDDISSGSTSQICMMGMIINLVLAHQSSSKYNIARLDEIDGGLDSANRMVFVEILMKIRQILGIEQLFTISHSCEAALAEVDVIQLAPISGFEDVNAGANIIYSWR